MPAFRIKSKYDFQWQGLTGTNERDSDKSTISDPVMSCQPSTATMPCPEWALGGQPAWAPCSMDRAWAKNPGPYPVTLNTAESTTCVAPRGRTGPLLTQMQGVGALGRPQTSHAPGLSFQMGRPWLILHQSFPGLATCAPSPKAPTLPQHLLLVSSLCRVIGAKPHSLCRIRQGRNLLPLPGDSRVIKTSWQRREKPFTRGDGTSVRSGRSLGLGVQGRVCHSDRCAREPGAPRRQVPPLPPTAWGCRPGAEHTQVFWWIFTSTRSRDLETEECVITTSLR